MRLMVEGLPSVVAALKRISSNLTDMRDYMRHFSGNQLPFKDAIKYMLQTCSEK